MRVIVVGAGVIGCAVASELCRRGADVTIIDMRRPGEGATNASAGVLAPYIEADSEAFLRLATASLSMYDEFVGAIAEESGYEIEYGRAGTLQIALTENEHEHLQEFARGLVARRIEHERLDAQALHAAEPGVVKGASAIFIPSQGHVGARQLTAALIASATQRGAVLIDDCKVDRVSSDGRDARVLCGSEAFAAETVVIAAGSWSGQIDIRPSAPLTVKPVRGQLLQLACADRAAGHVLWGSDCYVVPWNDGTLLVGATVEDVGFDERATVAGVRDLLDAACDLLPAAWNARFQQVRVGLRPATPDGLPIIGRASMLPNVIFATGHYRNGILLAPLTAELTADLVFGSHSRDELGLTRPNRVGL